ncbi:MAG: hypothetical protein KAG14_02605 [Mycoplasmataceae bacterium]|nr:hypothetical protein [Mycoplasmataceae bacterium]
MQTSFGYTTATGLSQLLESDISHDQVTWFLSAEAPPFYIALAAAKLECLSINKEAYAFALKRKLYLKAIRQAFDKLQILKQDTT